MICEASVRLASQVITVEAEAPRERRDRQGKIIVIQKHQMGTPSKIGLKVSHVWFLI